jgi:hypothetical protein
MNPEDVVRFWSYVIKTATCWLWLGYCNTDGYGRFRVGGKMRPAHRISLELHLGRPLAPGMVAAHAPHSICGHRNCVNPQHISEKTKAENNADTIADGTSNRGTRHGISKLTEAEVLAIRADTRIQHVIAAEYGIKPATVSDIKRRKSWGWLPDAPEASASLE